MDTKLKIGLIIMLGWINLTANGMSKICSDSLTMIINEETIQVSEDDTINLSVKLRNNSSINYLLYAFQNVEDGLSEDKYYCSGNNPAGLAVIIEQNGKRVCPFAFEGYSEEDSPVIKDDVINTFDRVKKTYTETMLILENGEESIVNIEFDVEMFPLETGDYKLYLLYFCGEKLENFVSKEMQKTDIENFNVSIYNGCLKSNKIDLHIK